LLKGPTGSGTESAVRDVSSAGDVERAVFADRADSTWLEFAGVFGISAIIGPTGNGIEGDLESLVPHRGAALQTVSTDSNEANHQSVGRFGSESGGPFAPSTM
jgi:hypothetical protein